MLLVCRFIVEWMEKNRKEDYMFSCNDYSQCYWFVGLVLSGWRRTGRRIKCSLVMIIPGVIGL